MQGNPISQPCWEKKLKLKTKLEQKQKYRRRTKLNASIKMQIDESVLNAIAFWLN